MKGLVEFALVVLSFGISATLSAAATTGLWATTTSLSLPELSWCVEVAVPGAEYEQKTLGPDGAWAATQAVNRSSGVVVSIHLAKALKPGDAKVCREFYWNRLLQGNFPVQDVVRSESGSMAVLEYTIAEFRGVKVNQRNVFAYLVKDGYWIDVHLSRTNSAAGEEDLLRPILKTVRIRQPSIPTATDLYAFGNLYYRRKDFPKAIVAYEKALILDKRTPTLNRTMWIVLVDQLGMAYGMSGDLDRSKRVYEQALAREPEYPMFYYNLACAFAEEGNRGEAIRNLRLAWRYKNNMLPGESMPDPRKDSSFRKYLTDAEFMAALKSMSGEEH